MYHSININVKQSELCDYFDGLSKNYNNLINVVHFNLRQCMTGLKKPESDRFENENEVIDAIAKSLPSMNAPKLTKDGKPKVHKKKPHSKKTTKKSKKTSNKKPKTGFEMPTAEDWFLGYTFLDAYFRVTKNKDYYNLPAHLNQDAIKDAIESWTGYFEALKEYKANPTVFTGAPNIPHYRKSGGYATVTLSNQVCKLKKTDKDTVLIFPKTKLTLNLGNAEFLKYKLMETKIKPAYGHFRVILTFDDGLEEPSLPEKPERVIGVDLGVSNIATISNNIGLNPVVIKGGVIKSYNQWFNKEGARLQSEIDTNSGDKLYYIAPEEQRDNLFAYRSRFFKDVFSKIAKYIIEYCKENNADTIVIGKSSGWKQAVDMLKKTNQAFCMIPHDLLIRNIEYRAKRAGIKVIINEESYTSKASFLDNDNIPTYGKVEGEPKFSGKRVKRGLYKSKDGIFLNADVNGASNIIRKALPKAFDGIKNFSYLYTTVESKRFHDFAVLPKYKYPA